MDPIPTIDFRPFDSTIDAHLYRPPTPPPTTDSSVLTPIEETSETSSMDHTTLITPLNPPPTLPEVSIDPIIPVNPPTDPPTPELALQPVTPSDPPLPPKQMGLQTFQKIKLKFLFLFK
jgi:hypothetical protein